jgi:poly(3-hydroxyalkanoate) depolymerase
MKLGRKRHATQVNQAPDIVRTVTVGGRRLRVAIRPGTGTPAGTGTGESDDSPPLLACNGIGTPLEALAPFTGVLDPAITVVRFDVPGVGGSPAPRLPYSVPWLARLAAAMMTELGYDRFDVLGISWGGGLAQELALLYPRRCRRLVLAATSTGSLMVPARPRVLLHLSSPRRHRDRAHAARIAGTIYGGAVRRRPELAAAIAGEAGEQAPVSRRGYLYQLTAGAGWTSLPWLRMIRQPALILAGADDPIIPLVNARLMAALLPAARLHVYPDGHLGLLTRAAELAPLVSEFLLAPEPGAPSAEPAAPAS